MHVCVPVLDSNNFFTLYNLKALSPPTHTQLANGFHIQLEVFFLQSPFKCKRTVLVVLVVVQLLSPVWLFATPWTAACQTFLSFTISQNLLKIFSIESVMPSSHCILCRPLLFLPSIFPSIRVFSNESALHIRWPKYWNFTFSISPSSEYSGFISFRIDWFDHCLMDFCFSEY